MTNVRKYTPSISDLARQETIPTVMKKYLVLYYSKTGNSAFVATRVAQALGVDLQQVQVRSIQSIPLLYLWSSLGLPVRTNITQEQLAQYNEIVVLGPIWGGLLIAPLKSVLRKCVKARKNVHFAVTCESSDEKKEQKYGYAQVLRKAKEIGSDQVQTTTAFSTALVSDDASFKPRPEDKIKFTEKNFQGVVVERLEAFLAQIRAKPG